MTRRAARFLTRLYPSSWRARYGEEFQTFLESRHVGPFETLNIVASAISERLAGSLTTLLYVCVAMIAPGGALYMAIGGAPLAQAFNANRAFWLCWIILEACSLAIVTAGTVAVAPVVFRILRTRRPDVVKQLVLPAVTGLLLALLLVVYIAAPECKGPYWAGNTLVCVGAFVDRVTRFLSYVIAHSKLRRSFGQVRRLVLGMASWITVASLIAAGYGWVIHYSSGGSFLYVIWGCAMVWLALLTIRAVVLRLILAE